MMLYMLAMIALVWRMTVSMKSMDCLSICSYVCVCVQFCFFDDINHDHGYTEGLADAWIRLYINHHSQYKTNETSKQKRKCKFEGCR